MSGYSVVDLETTGLSFLKGDRILEIGLVHVDPDGTIGHTWQTLVNPERTVAATEIHGITDDAVADAPVFADVADFFAQQLDSTVFVAHNARFDAQFTAYQFTACGNLSTPQLPYLDTLQLARHYLQLPSYSLKSVTDHLGLTNQHAHSALDDAYVTAQVLQYFMRETTAPASLEWQSALAQARNFHGLTFDANAAEPRTVTRS
ncbi:MAG: 3'-5' exonuclease [Actinomycetaceae bacterium]|nr:3'-5' exonuclease [Actinomycetaceae bacterium]MDY6082475.1 3'-5' exonuclease [Actinomycetaceae bacterium]